MTDAPDARSRYFAIEEARMLAIFLLVSYHVIGSGPSGGLQISGLHPARLFADFLSDLRMPLFALIAGFVYALKSVPRERLGDFLQGKLRRLALPGVTAISIFMLLATLNGTRFAADGAWWQNYIMPYAHFWFLQAILVIFAVFGSIDVLTGGRFLWPIFLLSCAVFLVGGPGPRFMATNGAIYLLPFFLLGVILCRYRALIAQHRSAVVVAAVCAATVAGLANVVGLAMTGALPTDQRDLQSLAFGMAGATLCVLLIPRMHGSSRAIGAYGFTIYLYHVIATSGARQTLEALGIRDLGIHMVVGLAAGIGLPILLHRLALQHPLSGLLVLGQRLAPVRRGPAVPAA